MQFIPPFDQIGVTPPGPWTNAAPQAGIQGSIVNADVFPAVQDEILAIIAADPNLTPSATDLGQAQKSIAYQIAQAVGGIAQTPATALWHTGNDTSTSAATIIASAVPAVTTRIADLAYLIFPANACTGATQINVGFGLVPLTRSDAAALVAGDYAKGQPLVVIDDGSDMRLVDLTPSQIAALIAADTIKISNEALWYIGTPATGSAAAYVTQLNALPAAGTVFNMIVPMTAVNAANATLDFGRGPVTITNNSTQAALTGGEINNKYAQLYFDGIHVALMNPGATVSTVTELDLSYSSSGLALSNNVETLSPLSVGSSTFASCDGQTITFSKATVIAVSIQCSMSTGAYNPSDSNVQIYLNQTAAATGVTKQVARFGAGDFINGGTISPYPCLNATVRAQPGDTMQVFVSGYVYSGNGGIYLFSTAVSLVPLVGGN